MINKKKEELTVLNILIIYLTQPYITFLLYDMLFIQPWQNLGV